jgi:hypothetical protein
LSSPNPPNPASGAAEISRDLSARIRRAAALPEHFPRYQPIALKASQRKSQHSLRDAWYRSLQFGEPRPSAEQLLEGKHKKDAPLIANPRQKLADSGGVLVSANRNWV